MNHGFRHLLGCLLPIILLFLLPVFGISSGTTFTIAIVLMFACHLFMMGGHDHDGPEEGEDPGDTRHQNRAKAESTTEKGNKSCR